MKKNDQSNSINRSKSQKSHIFLAIFLSIFIYGAYFFNLIRQQFLLIMERQSALESINAIAVPGTSFLNKMGSPDIFKSSLFYLALLGVMFLVFMLVSLLVDSPGKRALFLLAGLLTLIILTIQDRVNLSFSFVMGISFVSFYFLTLRCRIILSLKEVIVLLFFMMLISFSLFYGSKHQFFLKTRDKVLFNTTLGNEINLFYYTYSPLAASLISQEQDIYEGLIFDEEIKDEKPIYLGKGVFLSGKKEVQDSADFAISKQGEKLFISNRYGRIIPVESLNKEGIEKAISGLFSMNGFLFLTKICLYFFPAGIFILVLMGIRCLTDSKKTFIISSTSIASILVLFIWYITLTGNNPPGGNALKSVEVSRDGLAIAYYLYKIQDIPEPYIPIIEKMTESESPALKYWGAYLLGALSDVKKARILMTLMEDPHLNVRYRASQSLYWVLKEGSFRPLLIRLLTDSSWYVRCRIFSVFLNAGMIPSPA